MLIVIPEDNVAEFKKCERALQSVAKQIEEEAEVRNRLARELIASRKRAYAALYAAVSVDQAHVAPSAYIPELSSAVATEESDKAALAANLEYLRAYDSFQESLRKIDSLGTLYSNLTTKLQEALGPGPEIPPRASAN